MTVTERRARHEDLFGLPDNVMGEIIAGQLHAHPHPAPRHVRSISVVGNHGGCPLHIVVAYDPANRQYIVITAYIPGPDQWDDTFSRRTSCNV